jgi:hypothetical protein
MSAAGPTQGAHAPPLGAASQASVGVQQTGGLLGEGAVAIWHDIAPEGRAEFYAWHGCEHMPERLAIPGFLRGRRYIAIEGSPEFFNLYETHSTATLAGPAYLARLNAPTRWTAATVPHFRNVARSLCRVVGSVGMGQGGLIATFRYATAESATGDSFAPEMAAAIAARPGVAGCHWLVADAAGSALETAEKKARAGPTLIPLRALLVEGWGDERSFAALCRSLLTDVAVVGRSEVPQLSIYRLQNALERPGGVAPIA